MTSVDITLKDRLKTVVNSMGYEFVGCVLQGQQQRPVLCIYIDKDNGVTVDDCSRVSRQVSAMLDVEDPIPGRYNLEISSPGIDRPLFELDQYKKFLGSHVQIRIHAPINNRRNFTGVILRIEEMDIHLLTEQGEIVLPFSDVEKAKIIAGIC